jgi:hypothetical protein
VDDDEADAPANMGAAERVNLLTMARTGYDAVVNAIIRPPRAAYSEADLGPRQFNFRRRVFVRTDLTVRGSRGCTLQCSHWEPAPQ